MSLYTIDAPHHPKAYCASLEVRDGRVVRAAPIIGWSVGKPWVVVQSWAQRHGYRVETNRGSGEAAREGGEFGE